MTCAGGTRANSERIVCMHLLHRKYTNVHVTTAVNMVVSHCHSFLEAHIQGRGQVPAAIEWRPVTLVKRFAGSAETLAAIQLTSRRDDGRCCAQRSSDSVTS